MLSVVLSNLRCICSGLGPAIDGLVLGRLQKTGEGTVFFIPTFSTSLKTLGNSSKTSNSLTKSFMLYVTDYDDDALELAVEYLHKFPDVRYQGR